MGAFKEVPIAPACAVKLYTEILEISSDVHIVFLRPEKYCLQIEGYGSAVRDVTDSMEVLSCFFNKVS